MQQEEQLSLDQLEKEILQELNSPEAVGITDPSAATRKSYHISDFDNPRDKEMAVFTHAKKIKRIHFCNHRKIAEKIPLEHNQPIAERLGRACRKPLPRQFRA